MTSSATIQEVRPTKLQNIEPDQARAVQQSLLPIGTLTHAQDEVACRYSPLSDVGGDFADYFTWPDGTVAV